MVRDDSERIPLYQPAVDTDLLTIKYVLDKLDNHGTDTIPVVKTKELERIKESLEAFAKTIEKSPANLLLKDI